MNVVITFLPCVAWTDRNGEMEMASPTITFEQHAYETILASAQAIQQDFNVISEDIHKLTSYFSKGAIFPPEEQENLRSMKTDLSKMLARVDYQRLVINALLEDDELMSLMNLTKLAAKPQLYRAPLVPEILDLHEDIEVCRLSHHLTPFS